MRHVRASIRAGVIILGLILALASPIAAQSIRIAVLDFDIESSDPTHAKLGKGFAELVAVELSRQPGVKMIEREKRNEVLDELEFGVSGLAGEEYAAELGRLLASSHIVAGSVFDMAGALAVTCRVIDVETGEVLAYASAEGQAFNYSAMTKKLASELAAGLGLTPRSAGPAREALPKDGEVLASFSKAVDALDAGDTELAKESLLEASKLDPESEAVKRYLAKLNLVSPKFQFEDPMWAPAYNPAVAATLEKGMLYTRGFAVEFSKVSSGADFYIDSIPADWGTAYISSFTFQGNSRVGYLAPLGGALGISAEMGIIIPLEDVGVLHDDQSYDSNPRDVPIIIGGQNVGMGARLRLHEVFVDASLGASIRLGDSMSIGASASIFVPTGGWAMFGMIRSGNVIVDSSLYAADSLGSDQGYILPDSLGYAFGLGLLYAPLKDSLIFDLSASLPIIRRYFYDVSQDAFVDGSYPLSINASVIARLASRFFLSSKTTIDVYTDANASGLYLKETPVLELWADDALSLRLGYNFSYMGIDGQESVGHGFMVGATLRIGSFDLDLNYATRSMPLASVGGFSNNFGSFFFSASYSF
jgi:TolB-like protein